MNKRTWAVVDIDALKQNYNLARSLAGVRVMPVIKADAYGHGAVPCAEALCEAGADALSVSCVDEAIELRRAGIRAELLILGYTAPESFSVLLEDRITQTVMSVEYARALSDFARARGERARAQIKLDTGMGRLGLFDREDWAAQACAKEGFRSAESSRILPRRMWRETISLSSRRTGFRKRCVWPRRRGRSCRSSTAPTRGRSLIARSCTPIWCAKGSCSMATRRTPPAPIRGCGR